MESMVAGLTAWRERESGKLNAGLEPKEALAAAHLGRLKRL
jgi:hypothetical protein